MANADQILAGSTTANNVTLRNSDDGTLRVLKDTTEIASLGAAAVKLGTDAIQVDANKNVGIGVTPSAWNSTWKAIDLDARVSLISAGNKTTILANNAVFDSGGWKYKASQFAGNYAISATTGAHEWSVAPSGTAGNAITWTTAMTLNASGNLTIGATYTPLVANVSYTEANGYNGAVASVWCGKNNSSGRSISAGGTINASGADYAEYERNNGLTITKGSIVGFKSDGTLTLTFSEAVRFGIKSTNPSYVGGDTWGTEEVVGKRPEKTEEQTDEEFAAIFAAWEAALEAERQKVDRIAYSGKVPCNVTGATAGGYIIAKDDNGSIAGEFVQDPDFAQYKLAVGRVNRILEDGRCEVAVIVH